MTGKRVLKADRLFDASPWLFNDAIWSGDPTGVYEGFVYLITNTITGRLYVGKKFLWSMRKKPGAKRRSKVESDWRSYFGSNDELKADVKAHGPEHFKREILSLHTLKRDVNYCETREQWRRGVLETMMADGVTPLYYNDNIAARHYRGLVQGVDGQDRTVFADKASPAVRTA